MSNSNLDSSAGICVNRYEARDNSAKSGKWHNKKFDNSVSNGGATGETPKVSQTQGQQQVSGQISDTGVRPDDLDLYREHLNSIQKSPESPQQ